MNKREEYHVYEIIQTFIGKSENSIQCGVEIFKKIDHLPLASYHDIHFVNVLSLMVGQNLALSCT